MRVCSILNLKGGVGKSITAINLAHELATRYGKRVLIIDADPQNDLSQFYGHGDEDGLRRLLIGDWDSPQDVIRPTDSEGISVIPASYDVYQLDVDTHLRHGSAFMDAIKDLAQACDEHKLCDLILIDCPPAFSASCCAALSATTDVIVPMTTDAFSVRGMDSLIRQLAGLRRINPSLHMAGILITMYHNVDVVRMAEAALLQSHYPVFATHIRRTDKVPESTWAGQPLEIYSKRSSAAADYAAFADELMTMWEED